MIGTSQDSPHLCPAGTRWLFPHRESAGSIDPNKLSSRISRRIVREIGFEMNAHLFRHFAVILWLDANPGAHEVARCLLGHSKGSHTTRRCGTPLGRRAARSMTKGRFANFRETSCRTLQAHHTVASCNPYAAFLIQAPYPQKERSLDHTCFGKSRMMAFVIRRLMQSAVVLLITLVIVFVGVYAI